MRPSAGLGLSAALLVLLASSPASAQTSNEELKREIDALKQGQQDMKKQLEELKKLIQARPTPAPARRGPQVKDVVFTIGGNPIKGEDTAKLTLLEFSDYQWPFCARHVRETWPQIKKEFVDTGKLRYTLIDLPLAMHKSAFGAAEATRCAGDQGKYWEMHDRLFENYRNLEPWKPHAEAIGLDVDEFSKCMGGKKHEPAIRSDMAQASKAGIRGTPGFVIASTDPKDPKKVKGITFISGAQPFAKFKQEIEAALK